MFNASPYPAMTEMPIEPDQHVSDDTATEQAGKRDLPPAARRALAEAKARREAAITLHKPAEKELGGRGGADPARYGDWEIDGRAIDF